MTNITPEDKELANSCGSDSKAGDGRWIVEFDEKALCQFLEAHDARVISEEFGEPEIYMAKNLLNGSYATHPRQSECRVYLAQSKLNNDGKEAIVMPLYARKDGK